MAEGLSIVVVEKDRERARMIVDGLREAGAERVTVLGDEAGLARRIAEHNPDLVLIDLASPSRDMIEELTLATAPMQRPVAMFVGRSDTALT